MMLPTIRIQFERWKFNKNYGVYVSTLGRFRNKDKVDLPIKINHQGYCCVSVDCATASSMLAHRLVMLTWRPIDEAENLTVDHKDHNKRNNSLKNLEWVTYEENIIRAKKDYISCAVTEPTPIGKQYGNLYTAFSIEPMRAPAVTSVKDIITVKNDDIVINQVLSAIKMQMGATFESRKLRKKIKALATNETINTLSCYGFEIRGIKA